MEQPFANGNDRLPEERAPRRGPASARGRGASEATKPRTRSATAKGLAAGRDMVMEDNGLHGPQRRGSASPPDQQAHPELAGNFVPVHPSHRGTFFKRKGKKKKKKKKVVEEPTGYAEDA